MSYVLNMLHTGSYWLPSPLRSVPEPGPPAPPSRVLDPSIWRRHNYSDTHVLYRVFNAAEYRFYWDGTTPPAEGDASDETNATLPHTTTATFGNDTWYLVCDRFNGVLSSGFLPVGPHGERYQRIDVVGGVEVGVAPKGPTNWGLVLQPDGVVRIVGYYHETGDLRADTWAIAYTTTGAEPPTDTPDLTQAIPGGAWAVLAYDLPTQADGTMVKVRLQTRRDSTYSEGSTVLTATADAEGPTVPGGGERYPGGYPAED